MFRRIMIGLCTAAWIMCSGCHVLTGSGTGLSDGSHAEKETVGLGDVPEHYETETDNLTVRMDIKAPQTEDLMHGTATEWNYFDKTLEQTEDDLKKSEDTWIYEEGISSATMDTLKSWHTDDEVGYWKYINLDKNWVHYNLSGRNLILDKTRSSLRDDPYYKESEDDTKYNVDLFDTASGHTLDFATADEAFAVVREKLKAMRLPDDVIYRKAYAMDVEQMREQAGDIDVESGEWIPWGDRFSWRDADACYWYVVAQEFQGEPICYYDTDDSFDYLGDDTNRIIYNSEGIQDLVFYKMFQTETNDEPIQWMSFDQMLEIMLDRYRDVMTDGYTYEIDECEFCFYAKEISENEYEMIPVWKFRVWEEDGTLMHEYNKVLLNAETGEEVAIE